MIGDRCQVIGEIWQFLFAHNGVFFTKHVGLLGKLPINKLFDVVKYIGFFLSSTGNHKMGMLILKVFYWFSYFLKFFSTHFTSHYPKCIFHLNNHKDPAGWEISVERISRRTEPQGNIYKTGTIFNKGMVHIVFFIFYLYVIHPLSDCFWKSWNKSGTVWQNMARYFSSIFLIYIFNLLLFQLSLLPGVFAGSSLTISGYWLG